MKFVDLIVKSKAYELLSDDVLRDNVSHAYLLVSPDKLALDTLVKLFLMSQVCENKSAVDGKNNVMRACGVCPNCVRIERGYNSDVHFIPEINYGKSKVLVGHIDELRQKSMMTPLEGDKKTFVIFGGETMTEAAQNKLLKTLEEPPESTRIIIASTSEFALLPTIVSRCKRITLERFDKESLQQEAEKYYFDSAKLESATSVADGEIGKIAEYFESPRYLGMYNLAFDTLLFMQKSTSIPEFACKWQVYSASLDSLIGYVELIFRDIMALNSGRGNLLLTSRRYDIAQLSERYKTLSILAIMPHITLARDRLKLNGSPNMIIDELLLNILQTRALSQK